MNVLTSVSSPLPEESFILCVDDDKDFLESLRMALPTKLRKEKSYNVIFMENPAETLDLIKELVDSKQEISLIMTDQMMPEMLGIEFLMKARLLSPASMRVLLTGHAGMDSAITAINENVLDRYLTKPIGDIEDLALTLKRLLSEFDLKTKVSSQQKIILELYQFSNALNKQKGLKDILERTVHFATETLDCERISILLLEDEHLKYKAGTGIPVEVSKKIHIPIGQYVAGHVFKTREPVFVTDVEQLPWLNQKVNPEFKSFISAPVISAQLTSFDVPLGVLNVTNKRGNKEFTNDDLQTLTFIANTASIAINNELNRQKIEQNYVDTIGALVIALEARDTYTKGHSMRVRDYSIGIAKQLRLEDETLKIISDASILHDIGKIGIRDEILLKKGRLETEEAKEIQKHPGIGHLIVQSISLLKEGAIIVEQHHEHYDGTGYPKGLKGKDIHIGARIMAVADAFDAMTSDRPYRTGQSTDTALKELREKSGKQFDPQCVQAFEDFLVTIDQGNESN